MLDLVSQPAIGDPYIITQPQQPFLEELRIHSRDLKIGLISESWTGAAVDPEIIDGVSNVAQACEEMGHQVEEITLRFDLDPYYQSLSVMWNSALRFTCDQLAMQMNRPADSHRLESVTFEIYKQANHISVADLFSAKESLNTIRREVGEQVKPYDLLLTPTMAQLPASIGTMHQNLDIPLAEWYSKLAPFNAFTSLFNATGLPAISLPLCQSIAGLPIGIQFVAGFGQEALLLNVAAVFEKAMPWRDRLPPM
jgi:amidase